MTKTISLSRMLGFPSLEYITVQVLPGYWLALAVVIGPIFEFLVRGSLSNELARSMVTAAWMGGAVAVLLASGAVETRSKPGVLIALLVGLSILSAAVNSRMLLSLPSITLMAAGMTVFLLTVSVPAMVNVRRFTSGLILSGIISSLFAVQQYTGGLSAVYGMSAGMLSADPILAENIRARIAEWRAFSFFVYPNALGGFLLLSLPAALDRFQNAQKGAKIYSMLAYGFASLVISAGIYASGSLGAVISLLVAAGMVIFLRQVERKRSLIILFLLATLAVSVYLSRPASAIPGGIVSKITIWKESITGWCGIKSALLGSGPGSFGEVVGGRLPSFARSKYAHNWLIESWVETGLLGLLALGGLLGTLISACFAGFKRNEIREWGLEVGWLALLIHMMVDVDYSLPSVIIPWFAVAGLLIRSRLINPLPGWTIVEKPFVAGILVVSALIISTLVQGAWSGLLFGIILGAAVFYILFKSLTGVGLRFRKGAGDVPILIIISAGLLWLAGSTAISRTYPAVLEVVGLIAVMLISRQAANTGGLTARLPAFSVACLALFHGTWASVEAIWTRGPAFTSFPSPNFLGAFLVSSLGLTAWKSFETTGSGRILFITAALASLAGVAASHSSGAGLAAGTLIVLMVFCRGLIPGANKFRWWSASVVIALLIAIVAIPPISPMSINQRVNIWREGALALRSNPFGAGPGNYPSAVAPARLPSYTFSGLARYSLRADFAHCEPLQIAMEWGLPGLGIIICTLLAMIMPVSPVNIGWLFAVLGLVFHGLIDFPLRAPPIEILFAVSLGIISAKNGFSFNGRPGVAISRIRFGLLALLVSLFAGLGLARHGIARFASQVIIPRMPAERQSFAPVLCVNPVLAGTYLDEANRYLYAGSVAEKPEYKAFLLQRGTEIMDIGVSLSGFDYDSLFYASLYGPPEHYRFILPLAVTQTDIASYPRNLMLRQVVYARMMKTDGLKTLARELEQVSSIEPFYLSIYLYRGNIAGMTGNKAGARHLYRKAILLSREAGKRWGLNDYEKSMIQLKRADLESGMKK